MHAQRATAYQCTPSGHPILPLPLYALRRAAQTFLPEAMLPEQYFSPPASAATTTGAAALMCAVLEDALTCFQRQFVTSGRRDQRLAREAEAWFFSDHTDWLFSFVNICGVLDLDPAYIRLGLARWRQQYAAEPQKIRRRTMLTRRPLRAAA